MPSYRSRPGAYPCLSIPRERERRYGLQVSRSKTQHRAPRLFRSQKKKYKKRSPFDKFTIRNAINFSFFVQKLYTPKSSSSFNIIQNDNRGIICATTTSTTLCTAGSLRATGGKKRHKKKGEGGEKKKYGRRKIATRKKNERAGDRAKGEKYTENDDDGDDDHFVGRRFRAER
ncbi:hypothetical protein PUN28_001834 [Cardiocondyla obscurior]|uniref:Uncharacterized protein n=1 Tax=Cardiocondyla obscurior TaxID=286306 RepID=A0AAW2GRD5_9HYME